MADKHPCDQCEYVGVSPQALGIHRRHHHGVMGQSSGARYRRDTPAKKKNGTSPASKLPALGQSVQVTLLAMDPESGEVILGLDGKWKAVLR